MPPKTIGTGALSARILSLRGWLSLVLGALLFISLGGGLLSLWYGSMARSLYLSTLEGDVAGLAVAQEVENALVALSAEAAEASGRGAMDAAEGLAAGRRRVAEWLRKARDVATGDEATQALSRLDGAWIELQAAVDTAFDASLPVGQGMERLAARFQTAYAQAEMFKSLFREGLMARRTAYQERTDALVVMVWIALPVVALLGLALAYLVFRRVLNPLRHLASTGPGGEKELCEGNEVKTLARRIGNLLLAMDRARSDLEVSRDHLMQSEKLALVGKLAAGVAHTIRNPLTSVKMRLFSLERSLKLDPAQKEDLEVISEEIRHIDTIVRNFLEFSRPPKLVARPTSLSDVVDTTLNLLKHRLESYGVTVEVARVKHLTPINADPDQLKEVLVNLVLNACEAMGEGGRIVIREEEGVMEPAGRVVVVRVSDTGPGVPETIRERIFQPFFTTKGEGSGLGLPIAQRIVEEHGGWINLHSPEGRGATFALIFPHAEDSTWHRY